MNLLQHYAPYNKEMHRIARALALKAKWSYDAATAENSGDGITDTLKSNTKRKYGITDRVGMNFQRHGIFVEKGARKGYGGIAGSKWRSADGSIKFTNPKSLGKMNTGKSPAQVWLQPLLDEYSEIIADSANHHFAKIGQALVLESVPVITKSRT